MRWLADFFYVLAGLAYLPVALYQAVVLGKNRRGWRERFGSVPPRKPRQPRIWIHAVSLGEINATPRLVDALHERLPDHDILVSTTTDTGYARAVQLYGSDHVFRFPLDFSFVIGRVLRRIQPTLLVLVELEVWYNLSRMAAARGVAIAIVNGRLTERSARRLQMLGPFCRQMFRSLTWVGVQDEAIASRFRRVGVPGDRVKVTGSMKWDSASVATEVDGADALQHALGLDRARRLWVCGSTGPGEESMLLDAYRELTRSAETTEHELHGEFTGTGDAEPPILVVVPRKPERFDEVARLIERAGYVCVRRSDHPDASEPPQQATDKPVVILGDTMGELRKFYSLADVVFVGRTLAPMGGSDPMEVAALSKAMIVGPYTDNFRLPVAALRDANAIETVETADELATVVARLIHDSDAAQQMGARAREVVLRHQGATKQTVEALAVLTAH